LPQAIQSLVGGEVVNNTENRPAYIRRYVCQRLRQLVLNGQDVVPAVHESLARMRRIVSQRMHSRQWRGFSGRAITDVVNIGVGGSDLGPFMACQA
jgi:glucose-6-phosphate isomerase